MPTHPPPLDKKQRTPSGTQNKEPLTRSSPNTELTPRPTHLFQGTAVSAQERLALSTSSEPLTCTFQIGFMRSLLAGAGVLFKQREQVYTKTPKCGGGAAHSFVPLPSWISSRQRLLAWMAW